MTPRWAAAGAALARHPRHVVLAALTAGLAVGPRSPLLVLGAALVAVRLAGRTTLATAAGLAVLTGALVADVRLDALERTALRPLLGRTVTVRAILLEHPRTLVFGTRVAAARLTTGPGRGERIVLRVPRRVRRPGDLAPGREVLVRGRLVGLGPRDAAERRRHAHAVLRVQALRATGRRRGGLAGALDGVRARAERALTRGLAVPEGALARGMVLGQDDALTPQERDSFRATGLSHLVAASGANVALLAALALAVGAATGLGLTARLALALVLAVAYVPLAGGGPSIVRAGIMGGAGLVAAMAGRPASRAYALLLAAAATLALNPLALEDPGWQMSFAAVLSLLVLLPGLRPRLRRRLPHVLADAIAVTMAATAGTAPLIAVHFGRLSLVSLPANVLAVPAVAPVMWLGAIAGVVGQVAPRAAEPVAAASALPLAYLEWLADRGAAVPHAQVDVTWPPAFLRGAATIVHPRDLAVSFLDVGQGDATLLQHGRATVLVDAGPPEGGIERRLREAGVGRIDVLVLTHAARDHVGGAAEVLARHEVALVLDGEEAAAPAARAMAGRIARAGVRRTASDAGQVIRDGPLTLRVAWPRRYPPARAGAEPNDRATVVRVEDGAFALLLTADAESNALAALPLAHVDALKVAHHGSDDPGLPGLLQRLRPRVAVVSVGTHNTYGHPAPATMRALGVVPVVRRTDRDGTVRLRVHAGRIEVSSSR